MITTLVKAEDSYKIRRKAHADTIKALRAIHSKQLKELKQKECSQEEVRALKKLYSDELKKLKEAECIDLIKTQTREVEEELAAIETEILMTASSMAHATNSAHNSPKEEDLVANKITRFEKVLKRAEDLLNGMESSFSPDIKGYYISKHDIIIPRKDKKNLKESKTYTEAKNFFEASEKIKPRLKEAIKDLKEKRVALIKNPLVRLAWRPLHALVSAIRHYWHVAVFSLFAVFYGSFVTAALAPALLAGGSVAAATLFTVGGAADIASGLFLPFTSIIKPIRSSRRLWEKEQKEQKKLEQTAQLPKKETPAEEAKPEKESLLNQDEGNTRRVCK